MCILNVTSHFSVFWNFFFLVWEHGAGYEGEGSEDRAGHGVMVIKEIMRDRIVCMCNHISKEGISPSISADLKL